MRALEQCARLVWSLASARRTSCCLGGISGHGDSCSRVPARGGAKLVSPVCHASIVYLWSQTLGTTYNWNKRLAGSLGAKPSCPGLDPLNMRALPSALSVLNNLTAGSSARNFCWLEKCLASKFAGRPSVLPGGLAAKCAAQRSLHGPSAFLPQNTRPQAPSNANTVQLHV